MQISKKIIKATLIFSFFNALLSAQTNPSAHKNYYKPSLNKTKQDYNQTILSETSSQYTGNQENLENSVTQINSVPTLLTATDISTLYDTGAFKSISGLCNQNHLRPGNSASNSEILSHIIQNLKEIKSSSKDV